MAREFDGLEGVSDDELEKAADQLLGGGSDRPRSPAPRAADPPVVGESTEEDGADPQPLYKQLGYDTPEAVVESVHLLRNDRSRQETEKNEWKSRFEALQAEQGRMSPRGQMEARGEEVDELSELETNYHVDRKLLEKAIDKRVTGQVQAMLQPLIAMTQADQAMVDQYGPEYTRRKPQIDAFVASNPHVAKVVQTARERGMPDVAAEYALKAYTEAAVFAAHQDLTAGAEATNAANGRARQVAAPMQSREHTRSKLAKEQAGGLNGIDRDEAVARANRGDDRMLDAAFASQLPSEEQLLRALNGGSW